MRELHFALLIAAAAPGLLVAGGRRRGPEVEILNGLTRTDVPTWTLHVLDADSLEVLHEGPTDLNVTASLAPGGSPGWFRAHDSHGNSAFLTLGKDLRLREVDETQAPPGVRAHGALSSRTIRKRPGRVEVLESGRVIASVPLADADTGMNPFDHQFLPGGRGLAIWRGSTAEKNLFLVDVPASTITEIPGVGKLWTVIVGGKGESLYAKTVAQEEGRYRYFLARVDLATGAVEPRVALLPGRAATLHPVSGTRTLLCESPEGLERIDGHSGASSPLALPATGSGLADLTMIRGSPWAVVGQSLVDLRSGQVVGDLPGFVPISARLASASRVYYSAAGPTRDLRFDRLLVFGGDAGEVVARATLKLGPGAGSMGRIQHLLEAGSGRLVALSGTASAYLDHAHHGRGRTR